MFNVFGNIGFILLCEPSFINPCTYPAMLNTSLTPYKVTVVDQCHQLPGTLQTTLSGLTQVPGYPCLIYREVFVPWYCMYARRHYKDNTTSMVHTNRRC